MVVGRLIPAGSGLMKAREETQEEKEIELEAVDLEEALSEALSQEEGE